MMPSKPGTPEFDELNELAQQVEAHERVKYPITTVAEELAACLDYVRVLSEVLPIDEEIDRRVAAKLAQRDEVQESRKLVKKEPSEYCEHMAGAEGYCNRCAGT